MENERHKWTPLEIVLYILEILFCAVGGALVIYSLSVDGLNLTAYSGLCIIVSSGVNKIRRRKNLTARDHISIFLLAIAFVLYIITIFM